LTDSMPARQARRSTLVVAAATAGLGAWQLYRHHVTAGRAFVAAAAVLLVCAAIPPAAVWFNRRWMRFAEALGYVNSKVLLTAVFYLVVAPVGSAKRLAGHDPLTRRTARQDSYWHRRTTLRQSRDGYTQSY
jgi:Saxitoxin biosynthesis operon protein SxtJ